MKGYKTNIDRVTVDNANFRKVLYTSRHSQLVLMSLRPKHNIINVESAADLKMYTIYSPAHHKDGLIRATKKEAESIPVAFDGITTE